VYDLLTLLHSLADAVTRPWVRTWAGVAVVLAGFAVWFLLVHAFL
jgi:hypothetical protein